jgi:anti-sigma factor RsiW
MTCDEAEVLLHALLDDELDAGHARDVEAHLTVCARCAARFREFRDLHAAMSNPELRFSASANLRTRFNAGRCSKDSRSGALYPPRRRRVS